MDRIFDNEKENENGNICVYASSKARSSRPLVSNNNDIIINNIDRPVRLLPRQVETDRSGLVEDKEANMPGELGPWRPFREMVSLRDAMDRLFEDSVITPKSAAVMPKIDIKDKKDAIVVRAELPGMVEEEIDVEINEGVMTISGERKEEKEKEEEGYYYKESHSGTFSRSFTLPAEIKEDKAQAEMKDGILTVTIPKIAPKKATKIKVTPKKP